MKGLAFPAHGEWRTLRKGRPLLAWTDATAVNFIFAALFFLILSAAGQVLLGDPDTQWHIATGRWIIGHQALPNSDIFSYTAAGQPWFAKEWLAQVLLALAWLAGGWHGVIVLSAFAIALAFFLICESLPDSLRAVSRLALIVVTFMCCAGSLTARPHVVVLPVAAAWLCALARHSGTGRFPPWLSLPLLWLWANMHGAFTIGIVIAAALSLEAVIRCEPRRRVAAAGSWLAFLIACFLVVALTPYGLKPLLLNVSMAQGNEAVPYIDEWAPAAGAQFYCLAALAAACLVALSRDAWRNAGRIVLICALAYAAMRHNRFLLFFGLVAPLLAGPALITMATDYCKKYLTKQDDVPFPVQLRPQTLAAILALACVVWLPVSSRLHPALSAGIAPERALAAVPAALRAEPVYNSYDFGGFLIFNGVKTFVDGRTDQLFLGGFFDRMIGAITASEPARLNDLLTEHQVKWAIVQATGNETKLFQKLPGWTPVYADAIADVYVRDKAGEDIKPGAQSTGN